MEVQWDKPRGAQAFGTIALRIPLGSPSASTPRSSLSALERRMTERVVRDVDIVSQETLGAPEPAVLDGHAVSSIYYVGPGGDVKNTVEVKSGTNGIVVINGTVDIPGPVNMNNGQAIVGGGATFRLRGARSGALATFRAPGAAGGLNGVCAGCDMLNAATNSVIDRLTFTGGRSQILAANINNVTIRNTNHTITGAALLAISASDVTGLVIDHVTMTGQGIGRAIALANTQASITASSISNFEIGVWANFSGSVALTGVVVNNSQIGVQIVATNPGNVIYGTINGSEFTGNITGMVSRGVGGATAFLSGTGNILSGNTTNCTFTGGVVGSIGATPQNCPP